MATKDIILLTPFADNGYTLVDDNFKNLNLNKNHENFNDVQFNKASQQVASNDNKKSCMDERDCSIKSIVSNNNDNNHHHQQHQKEKSSWNNNGLNQKSSLLQYQNLLDNTVYNNSNPKKNVNSSTLSLHISAYENSIEGIVADKNDVVAAKKKQQKTTTAAINLIPSPSSSPSSIHSSSSSYSIQDPFMLPRQQQDNEIGEIEITKFKASKRLLNPKKKFQKKKQDNKDDDDIKLFNATNELPFEDMRPYEKYIDNLPPEQQRYVIDQIRIQFEIMNIEAKRMQAQLDASKARIEKMIKHAEAYGGGDDPEKRKYQFFQQQQSSSSSTSSTTTTIAAATSSSTSSSFTKITTVVQQQRQQQQSSIKAPSSKRITVKHTAVIPSSSSSSTSTMTSKVVAVQQKKKYVSAKPKTVKVMMNKKMNVNGSSSSSSNDAKSVA